MPIFGPDELRSAVMQKLSEAGRDEPDTGPEKDDDKGIGLAPYLVAGGGSIADAASTLAALGRSGTREGNPLLRGGTAELLALKGAGTAALLYAMHALEKHDHPKAAKVLGYAAGGAFGAAAAHNMTQGK